MPGRRGAQHQVGRRRPIHRIRAEGQWFGMGKQKEDATSGWLFPVSQMQEQRGFLVSGNYRDNGLDRPKEF